MSHGIYVSPDPSPKPEGWTVSLDNPWSQVMYRWYLTKKKHSAFIICPNEQELSDAEERLAYLYSDKMKTYLYAHPEECPVMDQRKEAAIACIEKNKAIISRHYASLADMRHKLIRYGFIDAKE